MRADACVCVTPTQPVLTSHAVAECLTSLSASISAYLIGFLPGGPRVRVRAGVRGYSPDQERLAVARGERGGRLGDADLRVCVRACVRACVSAEDADLRPRHLGGVPLDEVVDRLRGTAGTGAYWRVPPPPSPVAVCAWWSGAGLPACEL